MNLYFHEVTHEGEKYYLKTEMDAEKLAPILGVPLSDITKSVGVYENEAHLPPSCIANSDGLMKILVAPVKGLKAGRTNYICKNPGRLFDRALPMSRCGAYDRGGAYWGIGPQMRVRYNRDLSYVRYYRQGVESTITS